jgi:hypothetical protein
VASGQLRRCAAAAEQQGPIGRSLHVLARPRNNRSPSRSCEKPPQRARTPNLPRSRVPAEHDARLTPTPCQVGSQEGHVDIIAAVTLRYEPVDPSGWMWASDTHDTSRATAAVPRLPDAAAAVPPAPVRRRSTWRGPGARVLLTSDPTDRPDGGGTQRRRWRRPPRVVPSCSPGCGASDGSAAAAAHVHQVDAPAAAQGPRGGGQPP